MSAWRDFSEPAPDAGESWHPVCRLDDILVGTGVAALIGHQHVAVFRVSANRAFALSNYDPFSRASVLSRGIIGDIQGQTAVASPIYKQHFRLIDGVCIEDQSVRVVSYPVVIVDGMVMLQANLN